MQGDDNPERGEQVLWNADLVLGIQKTGWGVREIYTIPWVTVLELERLLGNRPSFFQYGTASLPPSLGGHAQDLLRRTAGPQRSSSSEGSWNNPSTCRESQVLTCYWRAELAVDRRC
jgi:hypothetical protein